MPNDRFLTAYLDLPFLKELFRQQPEDLAVTPNDEWPEVWQNVYRFLQRSAKIVIDADWETVKSNEVFTSFLFGNGQIRHVEPKPNLAEEYVDPATVDPDDPFSVFLFENSEVPTEELRNRKGLLFLRHDDLITEWPRLFREHVTNVLPEREETFDWSDLRQHATPLNALVISDKFAYRQFIDEPFDENIGALLQSILPREPLDLPVHVTLVTDLQTPYEEQGPSPNEICDELREKIRKYRPELEVRTTVVSHKVGSGHKDRYLFTNYGVFSSNDSFTFFDDGELNRETLITYYPNSTRGSSITKPRLQRLQNLCSDPLRYGVDKVLLASGANQNRLLEAIE